MTLQGERKEGTSKCAVCVRACVRACVLRKRGGGEGRGGDSPKLKKRPDVLLKFVKSMSRELPVVINKTCIPD